MFIHMVTDSQWGCDYLLDDRDGIYGLGLVLWTVTAFFIHVRERQD